MAHYRCPVWVGYLLASPLRKLIQNPQAILAPHLTRGMWAMDIGCAMGFFSLPMAERVGDTGRVICVDVQEKMFASLRRRASRTNLIDRIETRLCRDDSLGVSDLAGQIDFALAFAVVHEVPDASRFFSEICEVLKPGARLLLAEPRGHVTQDEFSASLAIAEDNGLQPSGSPRIMRSRSQLLIKP